MSNLRGFLRDESGQAMLEFLLLLMAIVGIVGLSKIGIRNITAQFWVALAKRIAAPCPTCAASDDLQI